MDRYRCKMCGYVYHEKRGDPVHAVRSGTPFAQVPETWVCPVCGAPKADFVKVQG